MLKTLDTAAWKIVGIVLLVALVIVGAVFAIRQFTAPKTEASVTIEEIKKIARLSTVEYVVSEVYRWEKAKAGYEWQAAQLMVLVKAKITGSVDLEKMQLQVSTESDSKSVVLHFEKGAILISDPEMCPTCIKTFTMSDPNVFNKLSDADRNMAQRMAISCIKQTALADRIEYKTALHAKDVLKGFLNQLGYAATIEFADIDLSAADPAATPAARPFNSAINCSSFTE